jgi:hypothetical protein
MGTGSPIGGRAMVLTRRTLETLIDLVEIKLSCIETYDQEDRRELWVLEQARSELAALSNPGSPPEPASCSPPCRVAAVDRER